MSHEILRVGREGQNKEATPATREQMERLVPNARIMGVKVPAIRRLAGELFKAHKTAKVTDLCALMDECCQSKIREEMLLGIFLLGRFKKKISEIPWKTVERWTTCIDNWEVCDQLACTVGGPMVAMDLTLIEEVARLTASDNFWQRRFAAALTVELNHRGRSHPKETFVVCEPLMNDPEAIVQKAVAWALREVAKNDEMATVAFLRRVRAKTAALVLREGTKNLTKALREELLAERSVDR